MPQMTDIAAKSSHACRVMCAGAATAVDPTASDYGGPVTTVPESAADPR